MEKAGTRRGCTDVLMIVHHLEMHGTDNGIDIDEYR